MSTERSFWRANALSLFFGVIFLASLLGQSLTGQRDHNNAQVAAGRSQDSYWEYVTSADFAVDVAENWQSEYLQFFLFIYATVWLVQQGSNESKPPGSEGNQGDEEQRLGAYLEADSPAWARAGGWRTALYSRSLGAVMLLLFLGSWGAQSIAGWSAYNAEQLSQQEATVAWTGYVTSADFWNRTLQNWQSEFLAVGSMAVFTIYLRHRGSPESKPVGAPHHETGSGR